MTDCEGERDRAIELLKAESEGERRATGLDILRTRIGSFGFVLAIFVFSAGLEPPEVPSWFDVAAVVVVVLLLTFMALVLNRVENKMRDNRQRLFDARSAIIEAAYRDCMGATEEE